MNQFNGVVYLIWILSEVILARSLRSGKSDKKSADRNTELYLWGTLLVSITLGVMFSGNVAYRIFSNEKWTIAGTVIIILGILFRHMAIRQLGRYFTVNVAIRKDHQLVQRGFYKYMRHPSYTGCLVSFFGFGISMNNWLSLAIVFVPVTLAFMYRIHVEEKVLSEEFGQEYGEYASRTKRLLPFIY